jgi:hypothetical protein
MFVVEVFCARDGLVWPYFTGVGRGILLIALWWLFLLYCMLPTLSRIVGCIFLYVVGIGLCVGRDDCPRSSGLLLIGFSRDADVYKSRNFLL